MKRRDTRASKENTPKRHWIITIAAREATTRKWLKPDGPAIESWYDINCEIFVIEIIPFCRRIKKNLNLKVECVYFSKKPLFSLHFFLYLNIIINIIFLF